MDPRIIVLAPMVLWVAVFAALSHFSEGDDKRTWTVMLLSHCFIGLAILAWWLG